MTHRKEIGYIFFSSTQFQVVSNICKKSLTFDNTYRYRKHATRCPGLFSFSSGSSLSQISILQGLEGAMSGWKDDLKVPYLDDFFSGCCCL